LSTGVYREVVEESTEQARERGVGGTPTFTFGDRLELVGAQEYRVFVDIVERLGARRKS
jgi:predicted DsbA family dithiol-disulfide isomerase